MWKGIWRQNEATFKKIGTPLDKDYIRSQVKQLRLSTENHYQHISALKHQNIVSIVGASLETEMFLISEYVRGLNLHGLLHNKSLEMDVPFVVKIAQGIAAGTLVCCTILTFRFGVSS